MLISNAISVTYESEKIIQIAKNRAEPIWRWSEKLKNDNEIIEFADKWGLFLKWNEPIRPGNLYLAKRNTGVKFLTCQCLGNGYVMSEENEYSYDFNECVLVE